MADERDRERAGRDLAVAEVELVGQAVVIGVGAGDRRAHGERGGAARPVERSVAVGAALTTVNAYSTGGEKLPAASCARARKTCSPAASEFGLDDRRAASELAVVERARERPLGGAQVEGERAGMHR